jgi:Zn-dependent protease
MSDHELAAPAPAPSAPFGREREPWWRRGGGVLVLLGALAVKGKSLLLLLPKLKVLTTSASMLVSIAAYSLIWGWRFAAGFVLLLLVHEMGHVVQLRREGIPSSAPLFIPFLGAVIGARSLGDDAAAEARVGLAGPVLGSLGAAAVAVAGAALDSDLLQALAFTGFFLNLFNLIPVTPLDGGRAFAAMAPWMWFAGLFLIVALAFASRTRSSSSSRWSAPSTCGGAGARADPATRRSARTTGSRRGSGRRWPPCTSAWSSCSCWAWTPRTSSARSTTSEARPQPNG